MISTIPPKMKKGCSHRKGKMFQRFRELLDLVIQLGSVGFLVKFTWELQD